MSGGSRDDDVAPVQHVTRSSAGIRMGVNAQTARELESTTVLRDASQMYHNRRLKCTGRTPCVGQQDQTSSQGDLVNCIQRTVHRLHGQIKYQKYRPEPALSICAHGDGRARDGVNPGSERAPITVADFITNPEVADTLAPQLYLERCGGGQNKECYHYPWYAYTHCCEYPEDVGKGFYWIIADEGFYDTLYAWEIKQHFGSPEASDIPTSFLIEELKKRYDVFVFLFNTDCYGKSAYKTVRKQWQDNFGPYVFEMGLDATRLTDLMLGCAARSSGLTGEQYDAHMAENLQEEWKQEFVHKMLDPVFDNLPPAMGGTVWTGDVQL